MPRMLLLVTAVLIVFTGCESTKSQPDLVAAVEATEAAGTSRIAVEGTTRNAGRTVPITCAGGVDHTRKRLQSTCTWDGVFDSQVKVIPPAMYVRGPDVEDKTWFKASAVDDALLGGTISFFDVLDMLRAGSPETRRVGEATVRGVTTVRYSLDAYCRRPGVECRGATARMDVWIDENGLIRRVWFRASPDEGTIELYDFGLPVSIERPAAADVVDIDEQLRPRPCASDFGEPIRARQAVEAVRRHGFSVSNSDLICDASSAQFDNARSGSRREGFVTCYVFAAAPTGAPTSVRREVSDGEVTGFALANIECPFIPNIPKGETTVERLEAAFNDLEGQIRK